MIRDTFHVSRLTLHALGVLGVLLTIAWAPDRQTEPIRVVGEVTNGTSGGIVPADLPVTLRVFTEMEETGVYTTTVGAEGAFTFEGLSVSGGETLVARAAYREVIYTSDFVTLESGQQELSLPLTIYETTEDPAAVSVTQLHLFVSRKADRVQVGEYCLVGNSADRTYLGQADPETGQRTTVGFALPQTAQNLRFDGADLGQRFLAREEGFADTQPISPGEATVELSFSYELSYREGEQLRHSVNVPVKAAVLVVPGEEMALEGEALTPQGTIDTQMGPALSYTAGPLAAGEQLAFQLVRPAAGEQVSAAVQGRGRNRANGITIGLATLAAAAVVVYLLWRSPAPGPIPASVRSQVEAIAALDEDFEAGHVPENIYRKRRSSLKRQARELLASRSDD